MYTVHQGYLSCAHCFSEMPTGGKLNPVAAITQLDRKVHLAILYCIFCRLPIYSLQIIFEGYYDHNYDHWLIRCE